MLQLRYVFGVNGEVALSRVGIDKVVYAVGAVLVVFDEITNTQTVLRGHTSLVTCLATNYGRVPEDQTLIVSGQRDPKGVSKPFALVWKLLRTNKPPQPVARLEGPEKCVTGVAVISEERIIVAGGDEQNTIFVYKNFQLVQSLVTGRSTISYLKFGERNLAIGSIDKIKVFDVDSNTVGKGLVIKSANALYTESHGLILDTTGKVLSFQQKLPLTQFPKTQALCWEEFGKRVVGITSDRHIYTAVLDDNGNWNIGNFIYIKYTTEKVRSIISGRIFLTRDHILGKISDHGEVKIFQVSPFKEAWGLAIHPTISLAVTGDFSGKLQFFDLANLRPISDRVVNCGNKVFCTCFSPDGKFLAVGQDEGWLTVLKVDDFKEVVKRKLGNERITEIKFSPDGSNLVVGCWDQMLYVLRGGNFKLAGVLKGHSSSPVSLQFSENTKFIISDSKDGQTLCWRLSNGERVTKGISDLRCEPDGWTGLLDSRVSAIWDDTRYGDRSDINTVAQNGNFLVTGDDFGSVNLFPFFSPRGTDHLDQQHNVHFAAVTRVLFAPTRLLLSLGGMDHALCVWELSDKVQEKPPPLLHPKIKRSWDGN